MLLIVGWTNEKRRDATMKKLIHRWNRWLEWKDLAWMFPWWKKILIFLGIVRNEWFEHFCDWRNEK